MGVIQGMTIGYMDTRSLDYGFYGWGIRVIAYTGFRD